MSEFSNQPKRSISLRQLTVSKTALFISKNRTPHIKEPLPVSLSNDILKSLKSQSSINSTTLSLLNNEKFTITEADLSFCKVSLRSLSILLRHKLRFLSLRNTKVEQSETTVRNDRINLIEILLLLSPTLVFLDTSGFQHSDLFTELIKKGIFPHLEYVSIYCNANDDDKSLQAILKERHNLRFLEFSQCKHIRNISFLEEVPNLETLSLQSLLSLTMDEKQLVMVLRKLSKLRSVNLDMDKIFSVLGEAFGNNSDPLWPQLQSIDLSFQASEIGQFEEQAIIEEVIKRHTNLEYIDISNNHNSDLSPSFPTSVKIANGASMKKVMNSIRMPRTPATLLPAIYALNMTAARIWRRYNELSTDDLNELLRSIVRIIKIIPSGEEKVRENASTIVQVMCSENIFRLEPQLLSRCLTAIDYTIDEKYMIKMGYLIKIKDLVDYCVLDYEDYCRAAFRYPLDYIDESCVARTNILAAFVPKLTLVTINSLMDDIHDTIRRLTIIIGQENMDNKYTTIAENLLTIIVAVTGHSKEMCVRLSTQYPLLYMVCLLFHKPKSYSTKIIECIVEILNNMTASIDGISFERGELITALTSTLDRLESLITTKMIELYDDDTIDKAIWSLICSLIQSSNYDGLTIAVAQSPSRIADDADNSDDSDDFDMDSDDDDVDDADDADNSDDSDDFDTDDDIDDDADDAEDYEG